MYFFVFIGENKLTYLLKAGELWNQIKARKQFRQKNNICAVCSDGFFVNLKKIHPLVC